MNNAALIALEGPSAPLSLDEVAVLLGKARRQGTRLGVLAGGEPTERRDLPRLLELTRRLDLSIGLVTNGRALIRPEVRELLRTYEVAYLLVLATDNESPPRPLPHHAESGLRAIHDEAWDGLALDLAVTVTAGNVPHLDDIVDEVASWARHGALRVRFAAPLGDVPERRWPAAQDVSRHVAAALGRAGTMVVATWEGFPPCLLEDHADLRDETLRCATPGYGPTGARWPLPLESYADRVHPIPCQDCLNRSTCPGAPRAFLEHDGEHALRPTRAVRANSFNFERCEAGGWTLQPGEFVIDQQTCSARSLDLEDPTIRWVIVVRDGGEVQLCHTPTSDFTEVEISDIKERLEQLYLDRDTAGAALDDFLDAVRRLRLHPECRGCSDRPVCPTAFVEDPEPPFQREERWIRKEVSRLKGRVLDVGCGEQLYRDVVDDLVASGAIEYHGLDPERAALDRMRESGFAGTLHHGEIESFDWAPGYFDYVLLLRSFNHLRDLDRAFDVIARVLRPRGQLVLCDSPPFALVRTADQVTFADSHAPKGHEHYRNWFSHQVLDLLARFPFRVDIHRPVSAKTSNQWILKLMRTG